MWETGAFTTLSVRDDWTCCVIAGLWKETQRDRRVLRNVVVTPDCGTLVSVLQDKLNLSCIHSPMVTELMRGIRSQIEGLITGLPSREMAAMCLGLAHRSVPFAPLRVLGSAALLPVSLRTRRGLILQVKACFYLKSCFLKEGALQFAPTL